MGANVSSQSQRFEQTLSNKMTNSQFTKASCVLSQDNSITVKAGGKFTRRNCNIENKTQCWTISNSNMDALMDTIQSTLSEMAADQKNKGLNLGQVNVSAQDNTTITTMLQDMRNTCSTVSETWQSQNNSMTIEGDYLDENCTNRNLMQGHSEASCVMKAVTKMLQEGDTSSTASQSNIGLSLLELLILLALVFGWPLISKFMVARMFGKEFVPYVVTGLIVGMVLSVFVFKHISISWPGFPDPTNLNVNMQFGYFILCGLLGILAGAVIKLVFVRGGAKMRASKNPRLRKYADYISSEEQEMKLNPIGAARNKFKYIDATVMRPSKYNEKEKEKLRRKALPRTVQAERRAAGSALKEKITELPREKTEMTDGPYGEPTFVRTYVSPKYVSNSFSSEEVQK
jgi:hypothetical protein